MRNSSLTSTLHIRNALPADAAVLSEIAMRSKAYWGYSPEFMDACREELTVLPEKVLADEVHYVVAEYRTKPLGFYAISHMQGVEYELEALFVDADQIGKGVGRTLMDHAKQTVCDWGGTTLVLQSDPHAARFYRSAGGELIGESESDSIPGRMLPIYRITLDCR